MIKPENQFIAKIHKRLPSLIYREKTNNRFRAGMPDVYYEGPQDMLWAEYKYLPTARKTFTPDLTKLQANWLRRAHANGRNVAVIVGSPAGGMVLPGLTGVETEVQADWKPIQTTVAWIASTVN